MTARALPRMTSVYDDHRADAQLDEEAATPRRRRSACLFPRIATSERSPIPGMD